MNFVENTIFHKIENSTTAVLQYLDYSKRCVVCSIGNMFRKFEKIAFAKNILQESFVPSFQKKSNGIWTDVAGFWGFRLEYVGIKYWCQIIQYVYVNHLKSVFFMALRLWYRCHSIFMFLISIFYHNIEEKATHGSVEVQISWENPYQKGRWKS